MITFIAPMFHEKHYPLIKSLLCQSSEQWKLIVYHNGYNSVAQSEIENIDSRIVYIESDTNSGAWGCYNRKAALEIVDTQYVIQTSIQDYYTPWAVDTILGNPADLIYFNSINHLTGPQVLDCELSPGKVDWGNVCVKTNIAKAAGIPEPESFTADWLTFSKILQDNPNMTKLKIDQVLTIHC